MEAPGEGEATEGAFSFYNFHQTAAPLPSECVSPQGVPSVHRCQLASRRPTRPTKDKAHGPTSFGDVGGSDSLFRGSQDGALRVPFLSKSGGGAVALSVTLLELEKGRGYRLCHGMACSEKQPDHLAVPVL